MLANISCILSPQAYESNMWGLHTCSTKDRSKCPRSGRGSASCFVLVQWIGKRKCLSMGIMLAITVAGTYTCSQLMWYIVYFIVIHLCTAYAYLHAYPQTHIKATHQSNTSKQHIKATYQSNHEHRCTYHLPLNAYLPPPKHVAGLTSLHLTSPTCWTIHNLHRDWSLLYMIPLNLGTLPWVSSGCIHPAIPVAFGTRATLAFGKLCGWSR